MQKNERAMLQFKRYESIGHRDNAAFMEQIRAQVPEDILFAVQEKVDGVNACLLCDDLDIRMARRNGLLKPGEDFHGQQEILERYSGPVYMLFNLLKREWPDLTDILVYGELFGGAYPHPDIPAIPYTSPVQRRTWYCPGHEFYAFDVYVHTGSNGFYLPVGKTEELLRDNGFFYARTLFTGRLEECLACPDDFQTLVPDWLGLPLLPDNRGEGIVIKPLQPAFLPDGTRIAVKCKPTRRKGPASGHRNLRTTRAVSSPPDP